MTLWIKFGINLRTIQHDLKERFAYFSLKKADGCYALDPAFLEKLRAKDMERFAAIAGLLPSLSTDALVKLLDARRDNTRLIKGHDYICAYAVRLACRKRWKRRCVLI